MTPRLSQQILSLRRKIERYRVQIADTERKIDEKERTLASILEKMGVQTVQEALRLEQETLRNSLKHLEAAEHDLVG